MSARRNRIWAALSALGIVAGSLGPWIVGGTIRSFPGIGEDETITLVAGAVVLVPALAPRLWWLAVAAVSVSLGMSVHALSVLVGLGADHAPTIGWGLLLVVLASVSYVAWAVRAAGALRLRVIALVPLAAALVVAFSVGPVGRIGYWTMTVGDGTDVFGTTPTTPEPR